MSADGKVSATVMATLYLQHARDNLVEHNAGAIQSCNCTRISLAIYNIRLAAEQLGYTLAEVPAQVSA